MDIFYRIKRLFLNAWLTVRDQPFDLWLDDTRRAPRGWYHALTATEAIDVLESNIIHTASLDHDLGPPHAGTGYDVVKWLAENPEFWPLDWVGVHSQNPVGRYNMEQTIARYGPDRYRFKKLSRIRYNR